MVAELNLVRALVGGDADALRSQLLDPATDGTRFLRFMYRHQLSAYAYSALQRLQLTDLLPRPVLVATKASALRERERIESLALLLKEVGDLFHAAGERVLFMKGPLFAQRFYGSVEARGVADLDLLVRSHHDVDRIEALLRERGFEPAFHVAISRRVSRAFAHHFEYRREGLPIDVHWVLQRHFTFAIDHERIWATAAQVTLDGRTYETTSTEYELVLQILGVLTDLQVGKLTLRPLVDIYKILEAADGTLEWGEFLAQRRREKTFRATVYVLGVALDALHCQERFANLRRVIACELESLPPTSYALRAVLDSRPLDLHQKLLALRLYETPLAASLAWWIASLPFRIAVYGITGRRFGGEPALRVRGGGKASASP